jgi:hypothetical protein
VMLLRLFPAVGMHSRNSRTRTCREQRWVCKRAWLCVRVCGDAGVWAERGCVLLRLSASRCLQAQGPNGHQPRCEHSAQHTHAAACCCCLLLQ